MSVRTLVPFIVCFFLLSCGGGGSSTLSLNLMPTDITLNPYGNAPLSARLTFTAPESGQVGVRVSGKGADGIAIGHQFAGSVTDVDVPVLGLYPGYVNEVEVEFLGDSGQRYADTLSVATQPFFGSLDLQIITNNLPADSTALYFFSRQRFAFDSQGEVRWQYTGNSLDIFRKLPDGSLLVSVDENALRYHTPKFAAISMLGQTIYEYDVPNYLHHEVRLLPWGNYLVAGNSSLIDFADNGVPEEDILVEIDAASGLVIKTWDFNVLLDPLRTPIPSNPRPDDWLHLNSAAYDPSDNSIYVTGQRQSIVAKIDYDTGDLRWILGAHELWPGSLIPKLLTPLDANGDPIDTSTANFWPYGPHAVQPLQDGLVAIYDNGNYREWYTDNSVGQESYSRAVEYEVDENNMTVKINWSYDAGQQYFTPSTGDIDYDPDTDRYLIGFAGRSDAMNTPRIIETDRAGQIRFEAVSNPGSQEYRVERLDLYAGL